MKKLVRGSIILSLIGLFVVLIYAQSEIGTATKEENRSEEVILKQELITNNLIAKPTATPEVKKVVQNKEEKEVKEKATEGAGQEKEYKSKVEKTAMVRKAVSKRKFVATAYCLKGRTALGHRVKKGLIAADPHILKLGSNVTIEAGAYSGTYLVSDTGGKIKGNRIDIWMPSCSEARRFGRRSVMLYPAQ
jgi:3D (Asp-Asp-Asp) domain-containing protein